MPDPVTGIIPDPVSKVRYILDMTLPYDNLLMTDTKQPGMMNAPQNFVWGNGLISSFGDEKFYYVQDHLGSPIRLMGEGFEEALAYDEFGKQVAGGRSMLSNPFTFTGYQTDQISEMHFAQARFYAPSLGRFGAEDLVRDGLNWYEFCRSNPMRYVDPSGLNSARVDAERVMRDWLEERVREADRAWRRAGERIQEPIRNTANNLTPSRSDFNGTTVIVLPEWLDRFPIRAFAPGASIVVPHGSRNNQELLQHEQGHALHSKELSRIRWWDGIALPSMKADAHSLFYYSNPWERIADLYGRVDRRSAWDWNAEEWVSHRYLRGSLPISVLYAEWMRLSSPLGFMFNLEDIHRRVGDWFNSMAEGECFEDVRGTPIL